MTVVELYSKPDCSLCDRAKEKLREIQQRHPFDLREITLRDGDERYEEFGDKVPVIVVDNEVTYHYRVPESEFLSQLKARAGRNG